MSLRLSRRDFLKFSGAGAAMALLGRFDTRLARAFQPIERTQLVHLHTFHPDDTPAVEAVRAAALAATDFSWLQEGDSVFVKVACNSPRRPPAVTSPDAVTGMVRLLQEMGAGTVYVGDMSGAFYVRHLAENGFGSTRESMRANGLLAAAEEAGATIHCFEEVPFAEAFIPGVPNVENHHWGEDLQVAAIVDEVDHIVNLPRLGKHCLAGVTLGLKNGVGWISDHSRMVLHRDAVTFHEKIAEINAIPLLVEKTRLTLTLVDQALTTNGPDNGYVLPLVQPLVIAAENVVCHDQVALLAMLWARRQIPQTARDADAYPAQSSSSNWYFVRTTWGEEASTLPTFTNLAASDAATHINYAFTILLGGRPDRIEIVPGGLELDRVLAEMLVADPELNLAIRAASM